MLPDAEEGGSRHARYAMTGVPGCSIQRTIPQRVLRQGQAR
jgi:hypothetical protein